MVLFIHWFMPYKAWRGKLSFQCGTREFKPKGKVRQSQKYQSPWQRILKLLHLAFDTSNTKKLLTSGILNTKIFGIDEQCNLKFEIALFTNCKTYVIFLSGGSAFFSSYFFFLPCLSCSNFEPPTISLLFLSPSAQLLCLPLWRNPSQSIKPSRSL